MAGTFYTVVKMTNDGEPIFDFGCGRKVHSFETLPDAKAFGTRQLGSDYGILATTVPNCITSSTEEFRNGAKSEWVK